MCSRKPAPRCVTHSIEALEIFYSNNPSWREYSSSDLSAHLAAFEEQGKHQKARTIRECLDLRMDFDSIRKNITKMRSQGGEGLEDKELRYRYISGIYAHEARTENALLQQDVADLLKARDTTMSMYSEALVSLSRAEARAATIVHQEGMLPSRDVEALTQAYDVARIAEAAVRAKASGYSGLEGYMSDREKLQLDAAVDAISSDPTDFYEDRALEISTRIWTRWVADQGRYVPDMDPEKMPLGARRFALDGLTVARLTVLMASQWDDRIRVHLVPEKNKPQPSLLVMIQDRDIARNIMEHGFVPNLVKVTSDMVGTRFSRVSSMYAPTSSGARKNTLTPNLNTLVETSRFAQQQAQRYTSATTKAA